MKTRITLLAALASAALLGAGCASDDDDDGPGVDGGGSGTTRSALRPLGDRDLFLGELRDALIARRGGFSGEGDDAAFGGGSAGTSDGGAAPPTDAPGGVTGGDTGGDTGGATAESDADAAGGDGNGDREVTGTNVQEVGVDEQDRVKVSADGSRLYVLQSGFGDVFPVEPGVVDGDVLVAEDADILPAPPTRTTLRIVGLDPETPDATPLRDVELDLRGRAVQGMYLHESAAGDSVLLVSSGGGYWAYWDDPYAFGGLDSVITRIDVEDPASAAIAASFRVDGQIVSSRRIGKHLFFASRFYPDVPGPEPWELSADAWRDAVERADAETLLPRYTDGEGGEATPLVAPERCFVAERPASGWYSPDIVTLAVVDLDTMTLADSECYLGATETLYASPNAVYLATTRWDEYIVVDEPFVGAADGVGTGGDDIGGEPVIVGPDEPALTTVAPYDPRITTAIHQFDIDGGEIAYRGSGDVRGHLGWNELRKPFRMSEKDGHLRVASFAERFGGGDASPVNLTVLRPNGDGALERVAELPNERRPEPIGKPGEELYASRFLGDRAYLVTFRQVDPLYVVDLSDPTDPFLAGSLEIEGYSDYLHPIGERHLLGIGRDAVPADGGGGDERGAFALGVKLALFDVGDPANPFEIDSLVVGQRGTQSNALYDHRGIAVQPATDEHPTRVAFGIDVAGTEYPVGRPGLQDVLNWYSWSWTALYGFDVHGGAGARIEPRGRLVVERAGEDGFYGPRYPEDRAVLVDDATYYVHGPDVWAARWDALDNALGPR